LKQVLLFISLCSTHTFRTHMVKTARLSVQQRTEIGESVNKNKSVAQLARQLKVSEPTIKRWQEEGLKPRPNYSDRPGRGRKRIFNTEQVGVIKGWARKGAVVKKIAGKAYKRFDTKASKSTFHRVLKSGRYPLVFARVRREKKLSEDNREKREAWCGANKGCHVGRWVFVDAKDMFLYYEDGVNLKMAWQDIDCPPKPMPKNPWQFRFYGAVSKGHKCTTLFFVPPSPTVGTRQHKSKLPFDAVCFKGVLDWLKGELDGWYPPRKGHVPQVVMDHAKQHTAKISKDHMHELGIKLVEGYPPQSWDLNIIENVWGMLANNMVGAKEKTPKGWYAMIELAWSQIKQSSIDKLVDGVHDRMEAIHAGGGAWVPHH
jgi:transposase